MDKENFSNRNENIVDWQPSFCQYHIIILIICNTFMAFFAVDEDDLIYACDATTGKIYWCLECFCPVKKRIGKRPHFYHLKARPSCRLYSKAENHLLAQLEIQKQFPSGEILIEKPFRDIRRVADACFEKRKIIFEIQSSPITENEVEKRNADYRSIGYETIWFLDDKRYNQRFLRPAESYLRTHGAYYFTIQKGMFTGFYDQFEIFFERKREIKGRALRLNIQKIFERPPLFFDPKMIPEQIVNLKTNVYLEGDRLHTTLQNRESTLLRWHALERQIAINKKKKFKWSQFLKKYVLDPYLKLLDRCFFSKNF